MVYKLYNNIYIFSNMQLNMYKLFLMFFLFGIVSISNVYPTTISSCPYNITAPGNYNMTSNITSSIISTCIQIQSSDVIFDCNNYTLSNNNRAILMAQPISNITIGNCNFYAPLGITIGGGQSHNIYNVLLENITMNWTGGVGTSGIDLSSIFSFHENIRLNNIDINDFYSGLDFKFEYDLRNSYFNNITIRETSFGLEFKTHDFIFDNVSITNLYTDSVISMIGVNNIDGLNISNSEFSFASQQSDAENILLYNNTISIFSEFTTSGQSNLNIDVINNSIGEVLIVDAENISFINNTFTNLSEIIYSTTLINNFQSNVYYNETGNGSGLTICFAVGVCDTNAEVVLFDSLEQIIESINSTSLFPFSNISLPKYTSLLSI